MFANKDTMIATIAFNKVSEDNYVVKVDEGVLGKYIADLLESFTNCSVDTFSGIMDITLGEELFTRVISDAFVYHNRKAVEDSELGVILNLSLNEINYKIVVASNKEKLGGIVYGIIS